MSSSFSSAGLLYLYLSGYEENDTLTVQQVNTYQHIDDGFYQEIAESQRGNTQKDNTVHIFAVVGEAEKARTVNTLVENGITNNLKRILAGKNLLKSTGKLDHTGNVFSRCVQEFFCQELNYMPKRLFFQESDLALYGICAAPLGMDEQTASNLISLWLERENPALCGKQLMIRSFFLESFVGRRMIFTLPDMQNNNSWKLIFEGGIPLSLGNTFRYQKDVLPPDDINGYFTAYTVQSILLNPIYTFGRLFLPNDICEEWHKVFLYLCAVSETAWDSYHILAVYETFLDFLEKISALLQARPRSSPERNIKAKAC